MGSTDIDPPDLDAFFREAEPEPPRKTDRAPRSVVFFDLVGSTARKLEYGHKAGVMAALQHNRFCSKVVEYYGGATLKELGDGIMAVFEDPLDAVLAADAARNGLTSTDLSTKIGLTSGMVDLVEVAGRPDLLGSVVDRAARIQAAALPDQVLVDQAQVEAIRDYLGDHPEIWLGASFAVSLRGLGELELCPVESATTETAKPRLPERLRVYGGGRLPMAEKLRFMSYAEKDVIEFGTGLTTFVSYFVNFSPPVWKEPVLRMLQQGVDIRCYALDSESSLANAYYALHGEEEYAGRAKAALEQLRKVRDELNAASQAGKVSIFTYETPPSYYALVIDPEAERSGLHLSPYLSGVPRPECPVFEVSRSAEPDLFGRVMQSLNSQLKSASPVD